MGKRLHKLLFSITVLFSVLLSYAQTYPVQVIPQLVPPPPVYLSDYANAGMANNKLSVQLLLTDLTETNRQVRIKMYIEGNGINAQSRDFVVGAQPVFLDGGTPLLLNSYDLAPYFELQNLQGISAGAYANALPEGLYKYCFEVYDFISGNPISNKSCTNVLLFLNDPPFLNLPQNNINLEALDPQYILFQWTPRHINVSNVEYEFSLVEIWDTTMDPQAVFLASPPVYQTTTRSTTLLYGLAEPQLLEGRRYAWRVQAKALDGIDEIGLFSNNGYSEIFSFTYQGNCPEPAFLEIDGVSTHTTTFRWQGDMENINYRVSYRKAVDVDGNTGNANTYTWFESDTNREEFTVIDLEPNTAYEWRVGGYCTDGTLTYSLPLTFTTMAEEAQAYYNCGIEPTIDITNQTMLETLQAGDVVKAGDFNIKIQEVSGSGTFSGKAYTTVGFLKNIKIAITFTDIKVNTNYQFVQGEMKTVYDPTWRNILDVDDVIDEFEDIADVFTGNDRDIYIQLDYDITAGDIRVDKDKEQIIIRDASGQTHPYDYDEGDVYTVTDASGDQFTVNPDGSVEHTGVGAEGGPATGENTTGITQGGQHDVTAPSVREIEKHPIAFIYSKASETKYGLDQADNQYERDHYPKVNVKGGTPYYPVHKAVKDGDTDTFLVEVQNSSNYINTDSLIFKTVTGTKIDAFKDGANRYKITVKGRTSYLNEEAIITFKDSTGKQHVLSSFFVHHLKKLPPIDVHVVLVEGADPIDNLQSKLNTIYGEAGVSFNVAGTEEFKIDKSVWDVDEVNGKINYNGSGLDSDYPKELNAIKNYYKQEHPEYDSKVYYLFVIDNAISVTKPLSGFMPKTRQWGFLFEAHFDGGLEHKGQPADIAAHELGHGVFALKHPFDDPEESVVAETWLMDYAGGTELGFPNWGQISSDALKLYLFQSDEGGMYQETDPLLDKLRELSNNTGLEHYAIKHCIDCPKSENIVQTDGGYFNINIQEIPTDVRSILSKFSETEIGGELVGYQILLNDTKRCIAFIYKGANENQEIINQNSVIEEYDIKEGLWFIDLKNNVTLDCSNQAKEDGLNFCNLILKDVLSSDSIAPYDFDFVNAKNYLLNLFEAIENCLPSISNSQITDILNGFNSQSRSNQGFQFFQNGKVYKLESGIAVEVQNPLTDEQIDNGDWTNINVDIKGRLFLDLKGNLQFKALGIRNNLELFAGKSSKLGELSAHIRNQSNNFFSTYNVKNAVVTPNDIGINLNDGEEVFADGDQINISNNSSFFKIATEGMGIVTTLLKTGLVEENVYFNDKKNEAVIHAPGVVTGSIEAGTTVVTDITSICTMGYDLATSKEARQEVYQGLKQLKTAVGEDPEKLIPLFIDVISTAATGNSTAEWEEVNDSNTDEGKRSHLASRGVIMTVKTVIAGGAFISRLDDIAESLVKKIDLQKLLMRIEDLSDYQNLEKFLKNASKLSDNDLSDLTKKFNEIFDKLKPSNLEESKKFLERLDNMSFWSGNDSGFRNTISQLHELKDIEGFDKVLIDLASQKTKYIGGKFMLDNIEKRGAKFIDKIGKFEAQVMEGADFAADIKLKTGELFEFKSWKKGTDKPWKAFFSGQGEAYKQFKNYLFNISSLEELEYVFDANKVSSMEVKTAFKELFSKKPDEIFKAMKPELRSSLKLENLEDLTSSKIDEIINLMVKIE